MSLELTVLTSSWILWVVHADPGRAMQLMGRAGTSCFLSLCLISCLWLQGEPGPPGQIGPKGPSGQQGSPGSQGITVQGPVVRLLFHRFFLVPCSLQLEHVSETGVSIKPQNVISVFTSSLLTAGQLH